MHNDIQQLISEIEAVAASLNIKPGTVGERAGQGGHFYKRLVAGKRVWPHTIETVRQRLRDMQGDASVLDANAPCDTSHDSALPVRQAVAVQKGSVGKQVRA